MTAKKIAKKDIKFTERTVRTKYFADVVHNFIQKKMKPFLGTKWLRMTDFAMVVKGTDAALQTIKPGCMIRIDCYDYEIEKDRILQLTVTDYGEVEHIPFLHDDKDKDNKIFFELCHWRSLHKVHGYTVIGTDDKKTKAGSKTFKKSWRDL